MILSEEFEYLRVAKTMETLKNYNINTWNDICEVKRFFEALLNEFQNSYKENDVNSIKIILLNRIMDLHITLEVLNFLPADVFTVDQIFLELEIRKNIRIDNYLEKIQKFKEGTRMKQFMPIRKQDAIKKIADYFNTHKFKNVGIVFEKQKDATAFLDEVKNLLNKEDSEVWNKKSIYNKNKVRILTDNARSRSRILSGWTCEKLFIEKKCFEKHFDDITYAGCICVQSCLNPDNVENYLITDED